jgi:hypothetical protein
MVDPLGLCEEAVGGMAWHHMVSKGRFASGGYWDTVKDFVHEPNYGLMMSQEAHSQLHAAGYNSDWNAWIEQMEAWGKPITKEAVDAQLKVMQNKYSNYMIGGSTPASRYAGAAAWEKNTLPRMLEFGKARRAAVAAGNYKEFMAAVRAERSAKTVKTRAANRAKANAAKEAAQVAEKDAARAASAAKEGEIACSAAAKTEAKMGRLGGKAMGFFFVVGVGVAVYDFHEGYEEGGIEEGLYRAEGLQDIEDAARAGSAAAEAGLNSSPQAGLVGGYAEWRDRTEQRIGK